VAAAGIGVEKQRRWRNEEIISIEKSNIGGRERYREIMASLNVAYGKKRYQKRRNQ